MLLLMQKMQLKMEGEMYGELTFQLDPPEPVRVPANPTLLLQSAQAGLPCNTTYMQKLAQTAPGAVMSTISNPLVSSCHALFQRPSI